MQTLQKIVNRYLAKAYQVYVGDKPHAVIARITRNVAKIANYQSYRNIIVKKSFFNKIITGHPNIFINKETQKVNIKNLFNFIKTLNIPNEIRQISKTKRLIYLRLINNKSVDLAIVDKNTFSPPTCKTSIIITNFLISSNKNKRVKYLQNIKNTSYEVFSYSGRTPSDYPSSNMDKPSARSVGALNFPGRQSKNIIFLKPQKVKTKKTTGVKK